MNTTLTTAGIALILAFIAALAAPLFVNWNDYRPAFEARASALLGAPVHLRGDMDARILPTPSVLFEDVSVGEDGAASSLTIKRFAMRLLVMPLLRGEVAVRDLVIEGPALRVSLSEQGEMHLPFTAPALDADDLNRVILQKMRVESGVVEVNDPSTRRTVRLEGLDLKGEAAALTGPLKLQGEGDYQGQRYGFTLATGRAEVDGTVRLALSVLTPKPQHTFNFDGMASLAGGQPRFEGQVSLAPMPDEKNAAMPWRLAGAVKADARRVVFPALELSYGPDERALRLGGSAEADLGAEPAVNIVASARQLDLDRLFGATPEEPLNGRAILARLSGRLPAWDLSVRTSVSLNALVVGGDLLQDVALDLSTDQGVWVVDGLQAQAPGGTSLRFSGEMETLADGPRFVGQMRFQARHLPAFLGWAGWKLPPGWAPQQAEIGGELTLSPHSVSLANMQAALDGARYVGEASLPDGLRDGAAARLRLEVGGRNFFVEGPVQALAGGAFGFDGAFQAVLPDLARVSGRAVAEGGAVRLVELRGEASGSAFTGEGTYQDGRLVGALAFERLDAPAFLKDLNGWGRLAVSSSAVRLDVQAAAVRLGAGYQAEDARFRLLSAGSALTLEDASAHLADGRFAGQARLSPAGEGWDFSGSFNLDEAALAQVIWPGVAEGRFGVSADLTAQGRDAAALLSSLSGHGLVRLKEMWLQGLDPGVFAKTLAALDAGSAMAGDDLARFVEEHLRGGAFAVPDDASASFTVAGGVVKLPRFLASSQAGVVTAAGEFDMPRDQLSAETTLTAALAQDRFLTLPLQLGLTFEGDVKAPARTLDVSGLEQAIALRDTAKELGRLDAAEADEREKARLRAVLRRMKEEREAPVPVPAPAPSPGLPIMLMPGR